METKNESEIISESIKSQPSTKSGEYTNELSEVLQYDLEEPNTLTKVVATFVSKKSNDTRGPSNEEITQKFQKKVSQLKKDIGYVLFTDLRLIFRILFFFASIGTLMLAMIRFGTLANEVVEQYGEIPNCIFQWSEWGECSAECSTPNHSATRTRYVIPETVVDMSNLNKDSSIFSIFYYIYIALHRSKCYELQQTTLCNVYECPVDLSTLTEFTPCQYSIVSSEAPQCIQYRILPPRGLVKIDQAANMLQICNCSEANYPF
uniref:Uncharacterized protein n=1 Tax=Panagrolaimus davidi TaxID=227884 RepID=A0A914QZS2_9BILA